MDQRVSSLQGSTAAGLSRLLQQREDSISSLKSNLELADMEKKKHEEEVTELRRHVDELKFKVLEQTIIIRGLEQREGEIRQEMRTLKDKTLDLQQQLKESEESCELLSEQKSDMEAQMSQLSELSGDSSQQLTFLQDQLKEKESQISELIMTNSAAADIQEELRKTQTDFQDAMDLCSQHEALIEERNDELNTLEAQIRTLSKDQDLWVSEKSRLQSEQERITSERDRAISECDRLMEQTASTSSEQSFFPDFFPDTTLDVGGAACMPGHVTTDDEALDELRKFIHKKKNADEEKIFIHEDKVAVYLKKKRHYLRNYLKKIEGFTFSKRITPERLSCALIKTIKLPSTIIQEIRESCTCTQRDPRDKM